jgi:hypothetical protein
MGWRVVMSKLVGLALAVTLGAAFAAAQEPAAPAAGTEKALKKYHSVDAEVVSSDAEKMTITVKVAGVEKTAAVSALAKSRLSKVKAGDKVILSCKDVDGGHKEVVAIRPARAEPARE